MNIKYPVVIYKNEEGYAINCPVLPGCWSQGNTEWEALENIKDAIHEYLLAFNDLLKNQIVKEVEVVL